MNEKPLKPFTITTTAEQEVLGFMWVPCGDLSELRMPKTQDPHLRSEGN